MKKLVSIILIVIIVFNIFLPTNNIFAYDDTTKSSMKDMQIDENTFKEDSEKGSSKVGSGDNQKEKNYEVTQGTTNSIVKNLIKFINILPSLVKAVMNAVTLDDNAKTVNKKYGKEYSIQKLVFNKINFFDINFFQIEDNDIDIQKTLKNQVAKGYYMMRDVAIVGMLIVLIYAGIRMAISSVAEDKAKYKQMLVAWVSAFALLLTLPYIMIAILEISKVLMSLFEKIMVSVSGGKVVKLEENLLNTAINNKKSALGFSIIVPSIVYWMLVFYQAKFFYIYAKRMFATGFLIVIAPLVIVQHAVDKIPDGQAGAFKTWITEFALNILMQPMHAMIYTVFMVMATNIMEASPILAIVFLGTISRGERVVRNLLNIKSSGTVQGMDDVFKAKDVMGRIG